MTKLDKWLLLLAAAVLIALFSWISVEVYQSDQKVAEQRQQLEEHKNLYQLLKEKDHDKNREDKW